jgi:hypothetical protein
MLVGERARHEAWLDAGQRSVDAVLVTSDAARYAGCPLGVECAARKSDGSRAPSD